ncbi:hypothetical protein [Kitasatospora purpeofusca]|uniref:hypothetical protein n=1 Tax=Kitasatospora purpeofusca TaxID=67352 RepID=UPI0036A04D4F
MEVDYPVPARTVVLTVAVDGPAEITVLAGGADGTELYRGKGAWSVLAPPERRTCRDDDSVIEQSITPGPGRIIAHSGQLFVYRSSDKSRIP